MLSLINTSDPKDWDFICLQELPRDIDTRSAFHSNFWIPIFPSNASSRAIDTHIRSIILVNSSLPSDSYTALSIPCLDLVGLSFTSPTLTFNLYSVYNEPNSNSAVTALHTHLLTILPSTSLLITGDFNKHDPLWSGPHCPARTATSDTDALLNMLATHHLFSCLPPGTKTFFSDAHKTWTTIDLVLATEDLTDSILKCKTSHGHGSDHLSIDTVVDVVLSHNSQEPRPQYRQTDWVEFHGVLSDLLEQDPLPTQFRTREDLDRGVEQLTRVFQEALMEVVPVSKTCQYSKRWWTKELTQLQHIYKRALRKSQGKKASSEDFQAAKDARNKYMSAIRRQKRWHWRNWVEEADEKSIWLANKYVNSPSGNVGASRIPPLHGPNGVASSTAEKCDTLLNTFFPPPPDANMDDTTDFEYPERVEHIEVIVEEVINAIKDLNPFKAPGPTSIPNAAIKHASVLVAPTLTAIANCSLRLGYHPSEWRVFTTITLRKPGKDDYTIPKAYRPIALEDTFSKVIESVIARRLITLAEEHSLLAGNHFGGRPGRTTTDAILLLVQRIKDAWRTKGVVSALFLDISQAFPTVSHPRLLHNLRKRHIPEPLVRWLESFLSDRRTTLKFDDFTSPPLHASYGIPQGSPLSPVLYLFYSSDLLEITDPKSRNQLAEGFIDDTVLVVSGPSIHSNIAQLETLGQKALTWSLTHACKFDIKKFQLVHFTKNKRKYSPTPLVLNNTTIQASDSAKYLGVILDRQLTWREQVQSALAKGTAAVMAVSRLTKPTFGMPLKYIRQLYSAVVLPRMEYGLQVWYEPIRTKEGWRCAKGSVGVARRLTKVQRLAARLVTGAFKSTATDTMEYHAFLPPLPIRLNSSIFNAAVRLASLPTSHPLHKLTHRCMKYYPRYHHSPLHEMFNTYPEIRGVEIINTAPTSTTWTPQFSFTIAESREKAIEEVSQYEDSFCIFTDGSGHDNEVGASAYAVSPDDEEITRQFHLGSLDEHTVFEGEVVGTILALDIVRATPKVKDVVILADNQAAIRAPSKPRRQSGRYLLDVFNSELAKLNKQRRGLKLRIVWVPGHEDIDGNENADILAKEAAEGYSSPLHKRIPIFNKPLPKSASALKAQRKKAASELWKEQWAVSPRAERQAHFDDNPPARRILKFYSDINRRQASLLTQLRTSHCGLNHHLHRIRVVDSPLCPRCRTPETVRHFFFTCQKYRDQRHKLRQEMEGPLTLTNLLANEDNISCLFSYIDSTNRFPAYNDNTIATYRDTQSQPTRA